MIYNGSSDCTPVYDPIRSMEKGEYGILMNEHPCNSWDWRIGDIIHRTIEGKYIEIHERGHATIEQCGGLVFQRLLCGQSVTLTRK